ncbi:MAG TPA: prepilin peptidase [Acidimicrobiales bacterium]|nr:prepilin peptidase [Acidimicrobiales bacterium]
MTALLLAALGVYGLAVGSFLNVVVHRVPRGESVVKPPSACPGCGAQIAPRDNIPVVSWLLLRARCRSCGMRISARYPLVELLTAGVFVAMGFRFGFSWTLPAEVIFGAGLVALSFIDLDHLLLPRVVVYPLGGLVLAALVVAAGVQGQWHRLAVAAASGAVEFAVLFAINLASPRALGFGDVRFGAVLGLALGWLGWHYAFIGFLAANLLGAVVGIVLMAAKRAGRRTPIPYGVFLSAGAFLAILAGGSIHYPA